MNSADSDDACQGKCGSRITTAVQHSYSYLLLFIYNHYLDTVYHFRSDTIMLDELQWIHNGDLSRPVRSTSSSSAVPLAIENVQLSHAGEYSCRAVLNNGSVVGPVSAGFLNVAGEYSIF